MRRPKNRPPTPPGEMLLEEYLKPRGLTQVELAARMGVPIQRVNTIVNGKRGVTAETAILLAEALDTSPELWMGLQSDHDLWHALRKRSKARAKPQRSKGHGKHQSALFQVMDGLGRRRTTHGLRRLSVSAATPAMTRWRRG